MDACGVPVHALTFLNPLGKIPKTTILEFGDITRIFSITAKIPATAFGISSRIARTCSSFKHSSSAFFILFEYSTPNRYARPKLFVPIITTMSSTVALGNAPCVNRYSACDVSSPLIPFTNTSRSFSTLRVFIKTSLFTRNFQYSVIESPNSIRGIDFDLFSKIADFVLASARTFDSARNHICPRSVIFIGGSCRLFCTSDSKIGSIGDSYNSRAEEEQKSIQEFIFFSSSGLGVGASSLSNTSNDDASPAELNAPLLPVVDAAETSPKAPRFSNRTTDESRTKIFSSFIITTTRETDVGILLG
mmetsp:Transcript_3837/g.13625  ORF Transcript_3837/g.13625 Transcript_3837/m.13625 type:complete len:304 (-) Transcript_3837:90-1001(-)